MTGYIIEPSRVIDAFILSPLNLIGLKLNINIFLYQEKLYKITYAHKW